MSSHALLLRLFLSPSFFSVLRALQYIRTYSDNIGITYYLTRRLAQVHFDELADKWLLICHLLVTRPSRSAAIEIFIIQKAEQSTLLALLTLNFLQCSLNDLAKSQRETESFAICQRMLQTVTKIIYGEISLQDVQSTGVISILERKRVKPNVQAALVGLGTILAGCPGLPVITEVVGQTALNQGRKEDRKTYLPGGVPTDETVVRSPSTIKGINSAFDDISEVSEEESITQEEDVEAYGRALIAARAARRLAAQSSEPKDKTKDKPGVVRRKSMGSSQNRHLDHAKTHAYRHSEDHRPAKSSPSLPNLQTSQDSVRVTPQMTIIQSSRLRGHYLHSEVQFLQALSAIADRLLVIPKPARVSALRAELTNLNHQLPAEVCLPLWCNYPCKGLAHTDVQAHHRVVRIPPSEAVVLNSAERAPYLLVVEVLHGDLDFDPTTRQNKDLLSKLETSGKDSIRDRPQNANGYTSYAANASSDLSDIPALGSVIPPTPIFETSGQQRREEEMDLVEQLYGTDLSVRSVNIDLTDSIVLPAPPKNKALDIANWSRATGSAPVSPIIGNSLPTTPNTGYRTRGSSSRGSSPGNSPMPQEVESVSVKPPLSLEDYSNRMEAAAVMLAQLNANLVREPVTGAFGAPAQPSESSSSGGALSWIPGSGWIYGSSTSTSGEGAVPAPQLRMRLQPAEAAAIRERIMEEMMALEEERMTRMREHTVTSWSSQQDRRKTAEDEGIVRRELNKLDPSATVVRESFASKRARIKASSQYGHLANWDCISVIVKTGADLRQEQLAGLLIQEFGRIWKEENCACWVRYFRILITSSNSGLVETITDAVSIHSIKKAEYARRLVDGKFANVSLKDHFIATYGDPSSARYARAQKNFVVSLAGYSVVTYLLQIKDRHNGNLLLDKDGHVIHIDFGFILESSPGGNLGFEAAPFKMPLEYVELLGGLESDLWLEFKQLFREGFEAARKHCDSIITIVELMQKDSSLPCFAAFGEQTAQRLRDRFQPTLTHSLVGDHVEKLITNSLGSAWTRLYDSYQYYSQGVL